MLFRESETVELKEVVVDDIKKDFSVLTHPRNPKTPDSEEAIALAKKLHQSKKKAVEHSEMNRNV